MRKRRLRFRWIHWIALLPLIVGAVLVPAAGCSPEGPAHPPDSPAPVAPVEFLADDTKADDAFGVFIGINSYPNLPGNDPGGSVNDCMRMMNLFTQQFRVRRYAMVPDGAAARKGTAQVLCKRVHPVERAR